MPLIYKGALEYNLMKAATYGYTTEVTRMLKQGAEVDAETAEGATPLVMAVSNYRPLVAGILLESGADPNKVTKFYESPLLIAVKYRGSQLFSNAPLISNSFIDSVGVSIIQDLLRNGADINFRDRSGTTSLNYAAIYGYYRFADLLLYYGADVKIKANDGTDPLMAAIWAGNDDIADLLIRNGADMESRDNQGYTPLLVAAQNGDTIMLDYLVREGVNLYETDYGGWDAIDIATRSGNMDAVEWLIRNGDKWKDEGRKHVNYYSVAATYKRKDVMAILENNNFPEKYHPHISQMDLSISGKMNYWSFYSGIGFTFREPLKKIGIIAGFDTKLWYTRILTREAPNLYYEYLEKSSIVYAGLFKEFQLTDNLFRSNFYLSASLSGGYYFADKYKGSSNAPRSRFKIIPALTVMVEKNNFVFSSGLEYTTMTYNGVINNKPYSQFPVWLRIGVSRKFFFESARAQGKNIKWY